MNPAQRDACLSRLDERSQNTWQTIEKVEAHLERINGHLDEHSHRITVLEENKVPKKTIAGMATGVIALVAALWKAYFGS